MIYLFDIHSTIFDEHKEYVPALKAAIQVFIDSAGVKFASGKEQEAFYKNIYADLKSAHISLQSDWDNRAFDMAMPTLRALFANDNAYNSAKEKAIHTRREVSKRLMWENLYPGALELLKDMKNKGHSIYLCTDANRSCAEDVMEALQLQEIVEGCYCCASPGIAPTISANPKVKCLPGGIFKPNTRIVGEILLDHAKGQGLVTENTKYADVFKQVAGKFSIPTKEWATASLITDNAVLGALIQETAIVGDSMRDYVLGNLAGILSIKAEYGTKSPALKESHDIIHSVTYWENCISPDGEKTDRWNLFEPNVKQLIEKTYPPHHICKDSISEMAWMVDIKSCKGLMEVIKENIGKEIPSPRG